jgi:hypothetical protein
MISNARGSLVLVNPVTEPIDVEFSGAEKLSSLSNKRIGLIDDSKVNAKELLESVKDLIHQRFGVNEVKYHRKPSASKPADPSVIQSMAEKCDYVIVGVGD